MKELFGRILSRILLVVLVGFLVVSPGIGLRAAGYLDLSTFTENDPSSKLTISGNRVNFTGDLMSAKSLVYYDAGVDYYSDFRIRQKFYFGSATNAGSTFVGLIGFSNEVYGTRPLSNPAGHGDGSYFGFNGTLFRVRDVTNAGGITESGFYNAVGGSYYYLELFRTGTTLGGIIYSDSGYSTELWSANITSGGTAYRYIYAYQGAEYAGNTMTLTGYVESIYDYYNPEDEEEVVVQTGTTFTNNITATTRTNWSWILASSSNITSYGLQYGTESGNYTDNYTTSTNTAISGATIIQTNMSGLTPGTLYYYRAFAATSNVTGYGAEQTFLTYGTPTILYSGGSYNANGSMTLAVSANETGDGADQITLFGWMIGPSTGNYSHGIRSVSGNWTIPNSIWADKVGVTYTDMTPVPADTWYIKAFAINDKNQIGYGDEYVIDNTGDFDTENLLVEAVDEQVVDYNMTKKNVVLYGRYTNFTGSPVTSVGFKWGTTTNLTGGGYAFAWNNADGDFEYQTWTEFNVDTQYYWKAGVYCLGTWHWSEMNQFLTTAGTPETQVGEPTVLTLAATNIYGTSFTANAQVTDLGDYQALDYKGFVIDLTPGIAGGEYNYGTATNMTLGTYTARVSELPQGRLLRYQAKVSANGSSVVVYGSWVSVQLGRSDTDEGISEGDDEATGIKALGMLFMVWAQNSGLIGGWGGWLLAIGGAIVIFFLLFDSKVLRVIIPIVWVGFCLAQKIIDDPSVIILLVIVAGSVLARFILRLITGRNDQGVE